MAVLFMINAKYALKTLFFELFLLQLLILLREGVTFARENN